MTPRWTRPLVAFTVCLMLGAASAAARNTAPAAGGADPVDRALGRAYVPSAADKLGRGVTNLLFGWLEIPVTAHTRYSTQDTAGSLVSGTLLGLVRAVARTGVGAYETVTFFVPLPADFAPILPTLEYFRSSRTRGPLPLE